MNKEKNTNLWSNEPDALITALENYKPLFENEMPRVLHTSILPGEITNVHTHQHPASLYIVSRSDFIRYNADGPCRRVARSAFHYRRILMWWKSDQ